jgi:hypothetical protein
MKEEPTVEHGQRMLGGLNRIFHCNHYNAHLQMAVLLAEGVEDGFDPRRLLVEASAGLVASLRERGYSRQDLIDDYTWCGFGAPQFLSPTLIRLQGAHYGQTCYSLARPGKICFCDTGIFEGMTGHRVREIACRHERSDADLFEVLAEPSDARHRLQFAPPFVDAPPRFGFDGCEIDETPIDEDAIIAAVAGLPLYGKSPEAGGDGLIRAFGVALTNHYADYYNLISYETYACLRRAGVPHELAAEAFVQCGHVCAFHTFGGIMESPEFHGLVVPQCRGVEDWVHGMVAVINAFGWGVWRVEKIVPGRELVIRIYNSYEGIGYRRLYPQTDRRETSFFNMGGVRGLAHLFWKIDIRQRPGLTQDFYFKAFNEPTGYWEVEQTHAIAAGDGYDRIVTRHA